MQHQEIVEEAIPVLQKNLDTVHTVAEWAGVVGYSRAHFSVLIKTHLGEPPSRVIRREKFKKIKTLVRNNPDRKGRVIAGKTGFKSVKSLYRFLSLHYNTTLTAIRKQMKNNR